MNQRVFICIQDSLPNCCGVDDVGWFQDVRYHGTGEIKRSGTGLFTATFVDNDTNRRAYEQLKKEHRLLYQSPVKRNSNTGNQLFLCVFQYRAPR
jgi:hypothetical protein